MKTLLLICGVLLFAGCGQQSIRTNAGIIYERAVDVLPLGTVVVHKVSGKKMTVVSQDLFFKDKVLCRYFNLLGEERVSSFFVRELKVELDQ